MILFSSPDYLLVTSDTTLSGTFTATREAMIVCFLEGTHVATPEGERAVETLAAGDLVRTAAGETRPVKWIGRQTVMRTFAEPLHAYPIRIAAGALGDSLPARDLFLSPDHALLIDGVLVQASALVNGTSICRVTQPAERFTYFHIELDDHALILAEGVPAETFVDNVTRRRFDNHAEYIARFGAGDDAIAELDLPRIKSARQLPVAIRARLAARAGTLGATAIEAA
ncbi:Hint domain-containing protein [Ancylobacter sp. Lp-2]|uniref:Hint domain-containing protein n=1 Tax=Ancylobacter sp. Lp-2 TaxID=2881339 RepID=UPI001E29F640|nr:Hint domain-containing protein [Ancylobacter sp. Lp-2]MCB4767942.1 Hint domain-containing protein [Ancylobacter sp. Lp-2]